MKKIASIILSFVGASTLALASCSQQSVVEPTQTSTSETTTSSATTTSYTTSEMNYVNPGKLTVSVSTDFAPMEFVDLTKKGQDKFVGADISFAKYLAEYLDVELYIKAMDFDSTLVALDNDLADIAISGFSYTESRATSYLYTDCYYAEGDDGQVLVVKKSDEAKYTTLDSLNKQGLKVAAQNGALQYDLVVEQLPNATLVAIDDLNSAYDSLKAGSIDAVAIASDVANTLVSAYPNDYAIVAEPFVYVESGNYALVKKGNNELASKVNACIKTLEKGQFQTWVDEAKKLFADLGDNAGCIIPDEEEDF